jgi:hypothetical protein
MRVAQASKVCNNALPSGWVGVRLRHRKTSGNPLESLSGRVEKEGFANDQRNPKRHEMSHHESDQNPRRAARTIHRGDHSGCHDNLGRQLIGVEWDSGVTTYVFINEIEIKTRLESEVSFF